MRIIEDRRKIYGDFCGIAYTSQKIKNAIYETKKFQDKTIDEALDMIAHKLARISQNPFYMDNWRDIQGYCQLVMDYIKDNPKTIDSKVTYEHTSDKDIKNAIKEFWSN